MQSPDDSADRQLARLLLLAPPIFVLHFVEEAPRFVEWFNAHVRRGITTELFWSVNLSGLMITVIVAGAAWLMPAALSQVAAAAWLGFLMFANGIFHLIATLVDGAYAPGAVTAALLYLPYFFWVMAAIQRRRRVRSEVLFAAVILGAVPMLIHGYRIVFLGDRLF